MAAEIRYTLPEQVTTALLLAAGTGSRLRPLTLDAPKCLTEVGGTPILGRLVDNLRSQGISRLVVVTGYLDHCIREFLQEYSPDMHVEYIFNPAYQTTNNIYSLWLARQAIQEHFVLIESDLVFHASMLNDMLTPDKIAISQLLPWMNGATVELNNQNGVVAFHTKRDTANSPNYKTVNIYSLSLQSWQKVIAQLERYIADERLGDYYEAVFSDMVSMEHSHLMLFSLTRTSGMKLILWQICIKPNYYSLAPQQIYGLSPGTVFIIISLILIVVRQQLFRPVIASI